MKVGPYRRLSTEELMLSKCGVGETLEGPLHCKEIKPVNPIGNQSWISIRRTHAEAEPPGTLATWYEELTHWQWPWCWERLEAGGEGADRGWDVWMASSTQGTWVWANHWLNRHEFNSEEWGNLSCCSPWCQRVGHDLATDQQQFFYTTLFDTINIWFSFFCMIHFFFLLPQIWV